MKKLTLGLLILFLIPAAATASDRHFSFSYESPVLNDGGREIESYTTYRFGRDTFFSGLKENLEFEMGLGDGVQTSLYLNFDQELVDDGAGTINQSLLFDGVATEFKVKLMDNLADPVGLGLYLETEFEPDELDVETKVILDKMSGPFLWTVNVTFEPHFHWIDNSAYLSFIPSAGLGIFLVPDRFFLGVEVQNDNEYAGTPQTQVESILSLGPVLSYTGNNWWTTLTVLPQIANLMGGPLDLTNSQRWQVRLANSWAL